MLSSQLILNVREVVGNQIIEKMSYVIKSIEQICKDINTIDES